MHDRFVSATTAELDELDELTPIDAPSAPRPATRYAQVKS